MSRASDQDAAKCQDAVIKSVGKCQRVKRKGFNRCKQIGLKNGTARSAPDLERCLDQDPKGKIAKACEGALASKVLPKTCGGVELLQAFPGCATDAAADLAMCLDEVVECRVCLALNKADGLAHPCPSCP